MRDWNIEVYLVGDNKQDLPATIFEKVTYELHPSFGKKAKQSRLYRDTSGRYEADVSIASQARSAF